VYLGVSDPKLSPFSQFLPPVPGVGTNQGEEEAPLLSVVASSTALV
jgi:hypothetical protein